MAVFFLFFFSPACFSVGGHPEYDSAECIFPTDDVGVASIKGDPPDPSIIPYYNTTPELGSLKARAPNSKHPQNKPTPTKPTNTHTHDRRTPPKS